MADTEELRLEVLIAKLRRLLGNIDESRLTPMQARDAVLSAVREYSKYRPIRVLDSLITTKDKADYDLSAKSRIVKVKEIFYSAGPSFEGQSIFPDLHGRLEGLSIFENPSLWRQFTQKLEQFRYIFDGSFEYDRSGKILRLIPAPSRTGDSVYYVWLQGHNALTVPEDDEDVLMLWAKAEAKEMEASQMSVDIRSVSGFGQSVTLGSTPESIMDEAEKLRKNFRNRFPKTFFSIR